MFFVKSLYIPTQDTQDTTSVKIPFVIYVWDIYSIVVISVNLLRDLFSCLSSMIKKLPAKHVWIFESPYSHFSNYCKCFQSPFPIKQNDQAKKLLPWLWKLKWLQLKQLRPQLKRNLGFVWILEVVFSGLTRRFLQHTSSKSGMELESGWISVI